MTTLALRTFVFGVLTFGLSFAANGFEPFRRQKLPMSEIHKISAACMQYTPSGIGNLIRSTLSCGDIPELSKAEWAIDEVETIEEPPELLRAAFVLSCLNPEGYIVEGSKPLSVARQYMACGHDARALDLAKIDRELAALPVEPILKNIARARVEEVRALGLKLAAEYAALGPDYKRILIDAPDEAWATWTKERDANRSAFDEYHRLEGAIESGSKSKLARACDSVAVDFAAYFTAHHPRTIPDAFALAGSAVGATILGATALCDAVKGRFDEATRKLHMASAGQVMRGPRGRAVAAAERALEAVVEDQPKFPIAGTGSRPSWHFPHAPNATLWQTIRDLNNAAHASMGSEIAHEIAAIKPVGQMLDVSFKPHTWPSWGGKCWDGNKVDRIDPITGQVRYQQVCDIHKVNMTERYPNVMVPRKTAVGIKPGNTLVYLVDSQLSKETGDKTVAVPVLVFEGGRSASTKKAIAVWGLPLSP